MVTERNSRTNSSQQPNRRKFWCWSSLSKSKIFRTEMHMMIDQGRVVPTKYISGIKSCLTCIKFSLPVKMKKELFERLSQETTAAILPPSSSVKRSLVSSDSRHNTPTKHTKFPKLKNNVFLVRDRQGLGNVNDSNAIENINCANNENNSNDCQVAFNNHINNEFQVNEMANANKDEEQQEELLISRNNVNIQPLQPIPNCWLNAYNNSPKNNVEDEDSKKSVFHCDSPSPMNQIDRRSKDDEVSPCNVPISMTPSNASVSPVKYRSTPNVKLKTCMTYYGSQCRWIMMHIKKNSDYFIFLPDHVVSKIFGYLPTWDLASLKCTCKDFKWVIEEFNLAGIDSKWCTDPKYQDDPCMQCGKLIDPRGDVSLCRWHPKMYYKNGYIGRCYWMCCFKLDEDALGCIIGLHDNNWMMRKEKLKRIPRRTQRKYMPKREIDYNYELLSD
ncbi:uncharacterized protein LOC102808005 [Saccoglossus kowalevskii]|uniref:Uncharacterized protein LOC102808005 n=1 Tax=Saccoglossus kowalevskii TaxID=10224 RepID=A0ABM0M5G5_SACKO|nr:PREDICTED: uncharacterized protein LOC102808005 [Saccoglossus kowalevskii]